MYESEHSYWRTALISPNIDSNHRDAHNPTGVLKGLILDLTSSFFSFTHHLSVCKWLTIMYHPCHLGAGIPIPSHRVSLLSRKVEHVRIAAGERWCAFI